MKQDRYDKNSEITNKKGLFSSLNWWSLSQLSECWQP